MRYAKWCGCVVVVFAVIVLVFHSLLVERPQRTLKRLMSGDTGAEIKSFRVSGQGLMIEIADEESVRYLATAFRTATKEGSVAKRYLGVVYGAHLRFGFLQQADVHIHSGEEGANGVTLSLEEAVFANPAYYWLSFPDPMPAPVAEMLRQMRN